ncbi:hypothetical protein EXS65_04755 [Candidatus Peribacteria bacterium]|nr:hypothetical protein [Candidatus Peribacteria bacterium]
MYIEYEKFRIYPAAVIVTSMIGSLFSPVYASDVPRTQDFVVTAYYSPLPGQSAYFRGTYEDEITFNGQGIRGADGTGVYTGMIAAPPSYAFGTRIELEGLGIGTVHDRGGRIVEWGDALHRIDLWMGKGEEGLARALTWGTRRVTGTVYPLGIEQMPREKLSLDSIPTDTAILATLPKMDSFILLTQAAFGDIGPAPRLLQSTLRELGYFHEKPTGEFGPRTQNALKDFLSDAGIEEDGSAVNEVIAAALTVALGIKSENLPDLAIGLRRGQRGNDVRQAQKLLRFLGYYRGRTDGIFSSVFRDAVAEFQIRNGLIGSAADTAAGRIGPVTQAKILNAWKMKIVSMKSPALLLKMRIASGVQSGGWLPQQVLAAGDRGKDVRLLQSFLKNAGYLALSDITGTFGERTRQALLKYQFDSKVVSSDTSRGAGVFGPATKAAAIKDVVAARWEDVRANGNTAL